MPWKTVKRGGKLVNVNADTGKVHGSFPDTAEGHRRAAGQIAIMARAEGMNPQAAERAAAPKTGGKRKIVWRKRKA